MNGVLQDRLVKALRLAKINDLENANRFLEETFLAEFNRRFRRVPASSLDAHRGIPRNLDEVLSWEEQRAVRGWCANCATNECNWCIGQTNSNGKNCQAVPRAPRRVNPQSQSKRQGPLRRAIRGGVHCCAEDGR